MKRTLRKAFTLIELLVVLAVAAILFTIIAIPMVQGFNLTRTSQAYADAQAAALTVRNLIMSDVGNAAGIYYNPGPSGGLNLDLPAPIGTVNFTGVKLDILLPAQGDPLRGPSGAFINPGTGKDDPTLHAPKGQINLPAAPGMSIVRYWIGLREPLRDIDNNGEPNNAPYNDPYSGLIMPRQGGQDNLFVLYRAEVQPLVFDSAQGRYVPNPAYFADANGDGNPDFDDPDFFRLTPAEFTGPNLNAAGQAKVLRINNWLTAGNVVTQLSRYDMIQANYNPRTNQVWGDVRDGIVPLLRVQPKLVSSEALKGEKSVRIGEENDNPGKIGPERYRTSFGQWSGHSLQIVGSVYTTPSGPGSLSSGGYVRPPSTATFPQPNLLSKTLGGDGFLYSSILLGGQRVALIDLGLYVQMKRTGAPYAFSAALASADSLNVTNGVPGGRLDPTIIDEFIPLVPNPTSGVLDASFDIRDVGDDVSGPYASFQNRVPSDGTDPGVDTGPADTPNSDLNILPAGSPWTNADTYRTINNRFNNIWARWNDFAPGIDRARFAKRFINLGQINQPGGIASPLSRLNGMTRAVVTPGSEAVYGPDQRPGPNYGSLVRYTRVAARPVGPNQYFINYTDMPEPDWAATFGVAPSYDPKVFDANSFVAAVLQPQYRAGYVELNSRFGEPIPDGNIYVSYRFQFTEPNDRVVVDYNTGDSVEVVLTIKNFPQSNIPFAQSVTVKGAAKVRNFFR